MQIHDELQLKITKDRFLQCLQINGHDNIVLDSFKNHIKKANTPQVIWLQYKKPLNKEQ